jgi:hypothetical protein
MMCPHDNRAFPPFLGKRNVCCPGTVEAAELESANVRTMTTERSGDGNERD